MADLTPDPNANSGLAEGGATQTAAASANQDVISLSTSLSSVNSATGQTQTFTSTADSAASSGAPGVNNTTRVNFNPHVSTDQIFDNPFDDYIDVIYNMSLGMVNWSAVKKLRGSNVQDVEISPSDYVIFASTAEQVTDPTYTGDYYNIKSLVFTSFAGHLPQNPMVAAIWDAKMKVIQPYGFCLREDLDDLAHTLGYELAAPMTYVYRLEIWFSGWKNTGERTQRIPFDIYAGKSAQSIVYFLCITTAEARVTPIGTEYDLSFQTVAHLTTRAESIVMHHDGIGAIGGVSVSFSKGSTFGAFIDSLVKALHLQVLSDTLQYLNIEYEFVGPNWLFDATFSEDGKLDFSSGVTYNDDSGSYSFSGKNVDIYTLINHVTNALPLVRKLHLREDDTAFVEPGCLWNIRSHIAVMEEADTNINQYAKYKFQYIIEPVLSYRSRLTEVKERNIKVSYDNQRQRAQKMLDYGMLVRVYDYFFTNDNSEVIDFQFLFKNFYYEPFPYEGRDDSAPGMSTNTDNTDSTKDVTDRQKEAVPQFEDVAKAPSTIIQASGSGLDIESVLGLPSAPQSATGQVDPATIHGYIHRTGTGASSQHSSASAINAQKYLKSKDQYLRFDMINSQITVRFDPRWLMNPYMAGRDFTPELPTEQREDGVFCYVHVDRVIFIRANRPNQKNYMNPNFSNDPPKRSAILGGFYQVLTAVNEFDGGRFVQKLNLFKYPHMNYFGTQFGSTSSPSGIAQIDPVDPNPTITL